MRNLKTLIFLLISMTYTSMSYGQSAFATKLSEQYELYREPSIAHQLLKQADILPMIAQLKEDKAYEVTTLGQSVEGRDIYLIKTGTGPIKVFMWSQMHGDEPTATMALWDMFNFFRASTAFEAEKKKIFEAITLYVIPMLNPDGAEKFSRRNALDIDLNRDALRLQSPESRILKETRDRLQADFGFNLHDQSSLYSAGNNKQPASISFLAPAYNMAKDVNEVRGNAMKMIVVLNEMLQAFIPGHVAKYDDTHEPRAFGDNIQKWGTSTILVESGGYYKDPERQQVRKMNFLIFLEGLKAIAEKSYADKKTEDYFKIPTNANYVYHLVVRDVQVRKGDKYYKMDIGINQAEQHQGTEKKFVFTGRIAEIGDMSTFYGYEELNAQGMKVVPGKVYPEKLENLEAVKKLNALEVLKKGYTTIPVANLPEGVQFVELPFNLVKGDGQAPDAEIKLGNRANFILEQEGKARYAVVNGFVFDLETGEHNVPNGVVY